MGLLNAFYFLPSLLLNRNRKYLDTVTLSFSKSGLQSLYQMLITFLLVTLAWVFFRANTLTDAFNYLKRLFLNRDFSFQYLAIERYNFEAILLLLFFILVEWLSRNNIHPFVGKYRKVFMSLF